MTRSYRFIARPAMPCLVGAILALTSAAHAATWSAAGTVKDTKGTVLASVAVSIKDSANLKTTTSASGTFTLNFALGATRNIAERDYSAQLFGNELVVTFPGNGELELRLVDLSGATLWSGAATLTDGVARASLPATSRHGAAILRMSPGGARVSQPITLMGGEGSALVPRISARTMANYPTLVFKKTGYADTTFTMTSMNQTGISVVMRDTTTPTATTCTLPPSANSGAGSFTKYWFSQGTGQEDGYYKTACGYRGTGGGDGSTDKMLNIANPQYFLAIPGNSPSDFNSNGMCGACVELTGANGKKIVATVTDECPNTTNAPCAANPNGHFDVSVPAFNQLGFSVGNPSGTTWKYVKCPVTGNVIIRVKKGNADQIYIENTILPIKDAKVGSNSATHLSYGAWQLSRNALGATITLVDYSNRTITIKIPLTGVKVDTDFDTGLQFPACN